MYAVTLVVLLLSCTLSESFQSPRFRITGLAKLRAADESNVDTKSPMTIVEKEADFQNTLDGLLAEARANNAAQGKAEGEDFTDEEIAIATAELKQLKFLNSKEELAKAAISVQKVGKSWESEEMAAETPKGGGPLKTLAIFGALTLVFAAVLLPIIDKIFPDPPSTIESSISSK